MYNRTPGADNDKSQMVNADDFEVQPGGAVYLSKDGKRKVITQWQEKKRTVIVHTYLKEKIPVGLIPYAQSSFARKVYTRRDR